MCAIAQSDLDSKHKMKSFLNGGVLVRRLCVCATRMRMSPQIVSLWFFVLFRGALLWQVS